MKFQTATTECSHYNHHPPINVLKKITLLLAVARASSKEALSEQKRQNKLGIFLRSSRAKNGVCKKLPIGAY